MYREFHYQARGRGHLAEGTPCQDATAYRSGRGVQVLCLADGAGSARLADVGAQALVDEGGRLLVERFAEFAARDDGPQVRLDIIDALRSRLAAVAERRSCQLGDLASTFLAVAVSGDKFIAVHIGDGVIGFVKNGEAQVASAPDNSEFANHTTFVTSTSAPSTMRLLRGSIDGVSGFVLMSDGSAESLYSPRAQRLAPALLKIVALVGAAPRRQLKYPAYKRRLRRLVDTRVRFATKDDCSIAVFARALADGS